MSRTRWLHISAWAFLVGCCLSVGVTTYLQVTRRLENSRANRELRRQIRLQEARLQEQERQRQKRSRRLLPVDTPHEDSEFLHRLQMLITLSGATPEQIESVPLLPLIDIGTSKPAMSFNPFTLGTQDRDAISLAHLPMGIQARSTRVILIGSFVDIQRCLQNIARYSAEVRWVNTNSLRLDRAGNTTNLRATLVLTRFVRPANAEGNTPTEGGQ